MAAFSNPGQRVRQLQEEAGRAGDSERWRPGRAERPDVARMERSQPDLPSERAVRTRRPTRVCDDEETRRQMWQ